MTAAPVLKQGETFVVCDPQGDVRLDEEDYLGVFHEGTRYISRLELLLAGEHPALLGSNTDQDNAMLALDLSNRGHQLDESDELPSGAVHLFRARFLDEGSCYERYRLTNHHVDPIEVELSLRFAADFRDVFEVRGDSRPERGELAPPRVAPDSVILGYQGLDAVTRRTYLRFDPAPDALDGGEARYTVRLAPRQEVTIGLTAAFRAREADPGELRAFAPAYDAVVAGRRALAARTARVSASNHPYDELLHRSATDLRMLVSSTPYGPYPYAGVPWYSTPFGRDGLIAALETSWVLPELAAGVLRFLAATQAGEEDPERDAQPGKVLHEARLGEMPALGEVPFGSYYGSVDATPLFVVLAGAHHRATGDLALTRELWPAIEAALGWIDTWGDADGDGFVEYERRSSAGLIQQGWKDSDDAVFYEDGRLVEAPVALCEVQGYVYQARLHAAEMAEATGASARAAELRRQAEALARRFDEAFWCEEIGTYALALDRRKRACRVRTSNAGHCLYSGIASPARAERLAATLMHDDSFSGWGIRTLAAGQPRYNPMAYHNGSVWPHDTALVAAGLARYGFKEHAARLLEAVADAGLHSPIYRLPELLCGFRRRAGQWPVQYPNACSPQAWAAGSVFLLIQACLGLSVQGGEGRVVLDRPVLPASLDALQIDELSVGTSRVDLRLHRYPEGVGVQVLRRAGPAEVIVLT